MWSKWRSPLNCIYLQMVTARCWALSSECIHNKMYEANQSWIVWLLFNRQKKKHFTARYRRRQLHFTWIGLYPQRPRKITDCLRWAVGVFVRVRSEAHLIRHGHGHATALKSSFINYYYCRQLFTIVWEQCRRRRRRRQTKTINTWHGIYKWLDDVIKQYGQWIGQ